LFPPHPSFEAARDLDLEQTLQPLEDAQGRGVSGRMIHDWMHARAAKVAGASVVLTPG
jgi:hypothetical protein